MYDITDRLFELQDNNYRDFHSRLMPEYDRGKIIGVRTPVLRKLAKELSKEADIMEFLDNLPHKYYEEDNLHAYIIENLKIGFDSVMELTEKFLPYIDNWATCDTFSPKVFKSNKEELYNKSLRWMKSSHEYTVRYGIVTQLQHFLDEDFREETLHIIGGINREEYYINMAIAWYYSFALIKQYNAAITLFEEKRLNKWIHNKSLQKAIESYRIDKETKDYLRSLKIK